MGIILSGFLIFTNKGSKNAIIGFSQSLIHSDYFWSVFNRISPFCSSLPTFIKGIRNGTKTYGLKLQNRSLPCFTELHSIWYTNGKKIVPENIFDLLTPVALSGWVCGDRSARKYGLLLCTESLV